MVKLKNIDEVLKGEYKIVLLCGEDTGKTQQIKNELLGKVMPDYKTNLSYINMRLDTIRNDPSILSDEYKTPSFFGSKKVILVEIPEEKDLKVKTIDVKEFLIDLFTKENMNNNNTFVFFVVYENLTAKSSLKSFFDFSAVSASLTFYKDTPRDIENLIRSKVLENGYKIDSGVMEELLGNFGGDRMIFLNELEKLFLYKFKDKTITVSDVRNCIQNNSISNIYEFVELFANLDESKIYNELQKFYKDGVYPIVLVRALIYHFIKLQLYKYKIDEGITLEKLEEEANPKTAWKTVPILRQQLNKFTLSELNYILVTLLRKECHLKGKPNF
ncbi:MAG: DNA polymerase III subunit delta [Rickettsiales bacterium]|jgi:DNA polymerase III delta subunit|nr:DNA polymerase III subunit delta [Rickettsiales bacterium]